MKTVSIYHIQKRMLACFFTAIFLCNISYSQNEQQESSGKKQAMVQLSFNKNADQSRYITAAVTSKNDSGKLVFVPDIKIKFYALGLTGKSFLQEALTNEGGKAKIPFPKNIAPDTSGISIIAAIESDKYYEDAKVQASVKEADLRIDLMEKDSLKLITATVTEVMANGEKRPVPDVEVSFGVKRLFGTMPLAEEAIATTDGEGAASFSFPKEIKGNEKGEVVIVATILDNEIYGNVEAIKNTQWGIPLAVDKNPFPRALWEPRAPIILIVSFSIIFGGIWITYGIVIFHIIKIKRKKYSLNQVEVLET